MAGDPNSGAFSREYIVAPFNQLECPYTHILVGSHDPVERQCSLESFIPSVASVSAGVA